MPKKTAGIAVFHTAAGTLSCKPALCSLSSASAPLNTATDVDVLAEETSTHNFRLMPGGRDISLKCTEGASGDPGCTIEGRSISGEAFKVPGDGCIYVYQTWNSYFPVTKKYCAMQNKQLSRVHQSTYVIGIRALAHKNIPLYSGREMSQQIGVIRKGTPYQIVSAVVDESDDFITKGDAYQIRNAKGVSGWASHESLVLGQCGPGAKLGICFQGD